MSTKPIGIFDSGVGGTSIWKELIALLPQENTLYLADSKNAPYGVKSQSEIITLSFKNTELLLNHDCKLIIVACNTATTNAISLLRRKFKVPFIGIEPAIKPAALQTQTGAIGILATKGTLNSELFHKTVNLYGGDVTVVEQVGEGLVQLIEAGLGQSKQTEKLLRQYIEPMLTQNIDHLVLGCTHYPYLLPLLKKILPKHVKIIDSGEAVAKQTKAVLQQQNMLNVTTKLPEYKFYTNADPLILEQFVPQKTNVKVTYKEF